MQRGPDREPITQAELLSLTPGQFADLLAGKVKETAALFCAASSAAKYGEHSGDIETCSTPRCVETRAIILENMRRFRERGLLV